MSSMSIKPPPVPSIYLDEFEQIKAHPSEVGIGPNNLLFTIQRWVLEHINGVPLDTYRDKFRLRMGLRNIGGGKYKQTPTAPASDSISYDDMTAAVAYAYLIEDTVNLENFRILGRFWHPRDLIFYNWCKGGWRRKLWGNKWMMKRLGDIQLFAVQNNYDKPYLDTDGDLLAWLRCQCTRHDSPEMEYSWRQMTAAIRE